MQSKGLITFPMEICNFHELKLIENFWEAYDLTKLDLSNNEIPSIPEEIATQEVSIAGSTIKIVLAQIIIFFPPRGLITYFSVLL